MNSSSDWFPSSSSPVTDGDSRFEVYTAPHPWGPWTKEMNYGIWGLTAGTFLASNEYTSADGGKAWTEFSGGYNGNIWPYGYMYAPLYFSTGPVDTYQAENATLNDVTVADTYPNYQGTGYVTGFHETGDSITFTINNVNGTGWHIVDIRYADSNNAETLSVAVNGQKVRQIAYLSETGDGYYASQDWADYSKIYVHHLPGRWGQCHRRRRRLDLGCGESYLRRGNERRAIRHCQRQLDLPRLFSLGDERRSGRGLPLQLFL
jgi:hypothetical protein